MSAKPIEERSVPRPSISLEAAIGLVEEVRTAAAEAGFPAAAAVTDPGGHLVAFVRDDSAPFLAASVAVDKAWTAVSFHLPTHTWNELLDVSQISPLQHVPRIVAVGGGLPIVADGKVIGGLGISGGDYAQDQQAGEAALRALGFDPST